MNKLFIEARSDKTTEYHFLKAILKKYFPDKEVGFVFMNGFGNLFNETILNQINLALDNNDKCLIFVDADTPKKNGGVDAKRKWILSKFALHKLQIPFFIYPNNVSDGDVECLMEQVARRDVHSSWFDCFEDYEKCVSGIKDEKGNEIYSVPNRKGKLHTYISSIKNLRSKERNGLGSGDWLFENEKFWSLESSCLLPLLDFLRDNLE